MFAKVIGFVVTYRTMRRMGASIRFSYRMARYAARRGQVFIEEE